MRGGAQPASGGVAPRLNRDDLVAQRREVQARPASEERTKELRRITNKIKGLEYRSERNGI